MYVAGKQLFVTLLLATTWHATYAGYNVTAYCTMTKPGTLLPSTESCSQYYACSRDMGKYDTRDCGNGYSFDKNRQSCQASANVECYFGLDNPCLGKTEGHVPNVKDCGGWYWCQNGEIKGSGKCPAGQNLVSGKCEYGSCPNTPEETDTPLPVCDIMPRDMYFGNTLDCQKWFVCKAGKADPEQGTCATNMNFDVKQATCNWKSQTDCSRITGEDDGTGSATEKCTAAQSGDKKPDNLVCSKYLVCNGEIYKSESCPAGQFWDVEGEDCVARQKATPVKTCNRCEGTNSGFVNAVDPNCKEYQVCTKGKKTGEGKCKDGAYFDEEAVACVLDAKPDQLLNYKKDHGACASENKQCSCGAKEGGKCVTSTECPCGLDTDGQTCKACKPDKDGKCCDCTGRPVADCYNAADGCNCGVTEDATPKCIECTDGTLGQDGICSVCDCESYTDETDCLADTACKCALNAVGGSCVQCKDGTINSGTKVCETNQAGCLCEATPNNFECDEAAGSTGTCECGITKDDGTECGDCAKKTCLEQVCVDTGSDCENIGTDQSLVCDPTDCE